MGKKGQVTVFLSLIIVLIFSLIFTLLEAARSKGLKMRLQLAVNAGLESAFAMYDLPLWEKYNLLLFNDRIGEAAEMEDVFVEYASLNGANSDGIGIDLLRVENISVSEADYVFATDNYGQVFVDITSRYMKEAGLAEKVLRIYDSYKSESGQIEENSLLNEEGEIDLLSLMGNMNDISDEMDKVEAEEEPVTEIQVVGDREEAQKTYDALTGNLSDYIKYGFLSLVCDPGELSSNEFDCGDFPSETAERNRQSTTDLNNGIDEVILFKEYIMDHLSDYSKGDGAEIEYVLFGGASELSAVSRTAAALLGIRTVLNFVFLNTHASFKNEAYMVAALVAGWTGSTTIIRAVQELLLGIWAIAEAVCDVKTLMNEGKIPLVKGEEDWSLSLQGAAEGAVELQDEKKGLDYRGYLRLLLYIKDSENLAYRAMDMIQNSIRETEPEFNFNNCIYSASVTAGATAESLFPFLPKEIEYKLSAKSSYSYGKT